MSARYAVRPLTRVENWEGMFLEPIRTILMKTYQSLVFQRYPSCRNPKMPAKQFQRTQQTKKYQGTSRQYSNNQKIADSSSCTSFIFQLNNIYLLSSLHKDVNYLIIKCDIYISCKFRYYLS